MIDRFLRPLVLEAAREFPAVLVLGPRQVGKSTLVQSLGAPWKGRYFTLDDHALLRRALDDPDGLIDGLELPVVLDEIQRAPDLLRSVKRAIDRDRMPGRFVLTGSANLLTMKSVSETLAGRVAVLGLGTLAYAERLGRLSAPVVLDQLFEADTASAFLDRLPSRRTVTGRRELVPWLLSGAFPEPALKLSRRGRQRWFDSYLQTYVERDLREISEVVRLPDLRRLLVVAAARTGQLLNLADVSRDLAVPVNTVRRHLGLLETTFQVFLVSAWAADQGRRMAKTPKLYFADTGLACHLLVADDWEILERQGRAGALIETWVAAELRKLAGLGESRTEIFFWRTHAGREVDFLLARGDRLVGIEVKWSSKVSNRDAAGLVACRESMGDRLGLGVILYMGEHAMVLDPRTVAIPIPLFFG